MQRFDLTTQGPRTLAPVDVASALAKAFPWGSFDVSETKRERSISLGLEWMDRQDSDYGTRFNVKIFEVFKMLGDPGDGNLRQIYLTHAPFHAAVDTLAQHLLEAEINAS